MKVLVTGADGQVGTELVGLADADFQVRGFDRRQLDITCVEDLERRLDELTPDLLVNCAAYTAVDNAEDQRSLAYRTNADALGLIGETCAARGIGVVHLSTDYVFDGTKDGSYVEDDATNPLNVYGASKLAGERRLREVTDHHVILRVSWVFGRLGRGFVDTMLRLARERDELRVVDDQVGAPSPAIAIARTVRAIAEGCAQDDAWGTYHFSTAPALSWCAFARTIIDIGVETGLLATAPTLAPISSAEWPAKATRPLNSRLDAAKLQDRFGLVPPDWESPLRRYIEGLACARPSRA